jgi:hypothetical protein
MLVDSMTPAEITKEIQKDFLKLYNTTADRLGEEYNRERKKLKIDTGRTYPKAYSIKTATKNTWILFFSMAPRETKYKGIDSINVSYVVYYYNATGLRVFHHTSGKQIEVYNGHFFTRYNERMHLNLDKPLDIVKKYFMYGSHSIYSIEKKDDKEYTIGISSEGILLGELQHDRQWLVNKTFISRDTASSAHDEAEKKLLASLNLKTIIATLTDNLDGEENRVALNVINAITGDLK